MTDDTNQPEFDDLDQQIQSALRVDIAPQQLERLAGFWTRKRHTQRWKRRATIAFAVAATILIIASLPFWSADDSADPSGRKLATDVEPGDSKHATVATKTKSPSKLNKLPAATNVRPATTFERIYLTARVQEREVQRRRAATSVLNTIMAKLIHDPELDATELVTESGLDTNDIEPLLLQKAEWSDEWASAIIHLLAEYGTNRSVPALLKLGSRSSLRESALSAVERIAGLDGLAQAATRCPNVQLRRAIYRRLLRQEAAIDTYLSLVQEPSISEEVIGTATELPDHIVGALIARLEAEEQQERLAAALVLGHANGPEVTNALIRLITEQSQSPAEAWIALMNCRGPEADQFLIYATRQPRLLGSFNRARAYWTRMVN